MFKGSTPVLHGRELLSTKYVVLLDEFRRLDPDLEIDNSSFISRKFGISVWTEDPGGLPETVLVFERGYYDQLQ